MRGLSYVFGFGKEMVSVVSHDFEGLRCKNDDGSTRFLSSKRFTVLEERGNQVSIKNLNNDYIIMKSGLFVVTDVIFYAGSVIKYIVLSNTMETVALLSKMQVKVHGLLEQVERVVVELGDNLPSLPEGKTPSLLMPPTAVMRGGDWALLDDIQTSLNVMRAPAIVFNLSQLKKKLEAGYQATTDGKFAAAYVPIYLRLKAVSCSYYCSQFVPTQEGQLCTVCDLAVVGADASGLLCSPFQI
ncbi:hypothetical protein FEM48_Zijuj08G0176600 [Ziziphus jujuba var. spinosa]|uniref:Coatomer alpha subunit C-terminal domain-containing protein n=1 Tax=Ziziphus jujuba var. spinosa TaxID=714518 RepID=A0A978V0G7_ZIZJJ|nr:hypothetical protein FEM48_Zijuj08G0176600 [Ziziphus jujuba var. spinosa]